MLPAEYIDAHQPGPLTPHLARSSQLASQLASPTAPASRAGVANSTHSMCWPHPQHPWPLSSPRQQHPQPALASPTAPAVRAGLTCSSQWWCCRVDSSSSSSASARVMACRTRSSTLARTYTRNGCACTHRCRRVPRTRPCLLLSTPRLLGACSITRRPAQAPHAAPIAGAQIHYSGVHAHCTHTIQTGRVLCRRRHRAPACGCLPDSERAPHQTTAPAAFLLPDATAASPRLQRLAQPPPS